ncbi:MAG: glycosyltransferase family 4 protein [Microthrixaceae bacterium]|nr:glycosyltransferase family 4 protein [Microthrixaceae bacterium]
MKVTILTQYFEPEIGAAQLRYAALVRQLHRLGHEVTVLTAVPNHPTGRIFDGYRGKLYSTERTDWGTVHRAWVYPAIGTGLKRYLNFLSFAVTALPMLRFARRSDVLIVETPPITAGAVGMLGSVLTRAELVVYLADLSTNSVKDLDIPGGKLIARVMDSIERRLYRRARYVTTVTDGLVRVLNEEYGLPADKVLMLENGADTDTFKPVPLDSGLLEQFGVEEGKYILYAGTHGYAHGLDVALQAAPGLSELGLNLLFVGEGSDKERIVELSRSMGLDNVSFFGQQSPDVVAGLYSGALAGLSTVRDIQVMRDARPAKLFACLSCAKPLIYSGAGEGAELAESSGGAIVAAAGDPQEIVDAASRLAGDHELARQMGESGRSFILEKFSWQYLVAKWADVVLNDGV